MAKKIYDITPPKPRRKPENTAQGLTKTIKKKPNKSMEFEAPKREMTLPKKERRFPLREMLIGAAIIVFLLAAFGISKLPKADIEITPKTDTLTLSGKMTADTSTAAVNLASSTIPARYVEVEKDSQQSFPATGIASQDGKASGTITVYNKTSSTFTLIKGTHFLSDSGKYFVTLSKIVIPAAKKSSLGSAPVQVQAEESGADYNIGPSKFSAPKLQGTSYYYNIYGESTSAMSGGYTGKVKKVTDDDISQAKDILTKKLLQDAKAALKSKITSDEVLIEGAIENSGIDASSDVKSGAIADTFNESAKVTVSALVFKKQDALELTKNNIATQLPETKNILLQTLQSNYTPDVIDVGRGKLTLKVQSSVQTYYDMHTNDLIDLFRAKSSDQIKQVVDQLYSGKVSELKVNLWPFWVHKAPNDKNRITVKLNFKGI